MNTNQQELIIQDMSLQPPEMIQNFSNKLLPVMKHGAFNIVLKLIVKMQNESLNFTSSQENTKNILKINTMIITFFDSKGIIH